MHVRPEALEQTIRYASAVAGVPIYVTENGIGTTDDAQRLEYVRRALGGVVRCLREARVIGLSDHTVLLSRLGQEIAIQNSAAPIRDRAGEVAEGPDVERNGVAQDHCRRFDHDRGLAEKRERVPDFSMIAGPAISW